MGVDLPGVHHRAIGEIHTVAPNGRYAVRIIDGPAELIGRILEFDEANVTADIGRGTPAEILASQLVNRYLGWDNERGLYDSEFGNRNRGRLAKVNRLLAGTYGSRTTELRVRPDVRDRIADNEAAGDPPMRPDQGQGTLTRTTAGGNPYPGISPDKTEPVRLRVFGASEVVGALPVISTERLEELYREEALAVRRENVAVGTRPELWTDLTPQEQAHLNRMRAVAGRPKVGTANPPTEEELTEIFDERVREGPARAAAMTYQDQPAKWRRLVESSNLALIERRMWDRVAAEVARSPRQLMYVDFQRSRFSRYPDETYADIRFIGHFRDGRFLLIASRRSAYLSEALTPSTPPADMTARIRAELDSAQRQQPEDGGGRERHDPGWRPRQVEATLLREMENAIDGYPRRSSTPGQPGVMTTRVWELLDLGVPQEEVVETLTAEIRRTILAVLSERGTPAPSPSSSSSGKGGATGSKKR